MTASGSIEINTAFGMAAVVLDQPQRPAFLLVLTHGSGGGVDSPDLRAAAVAGARAGGAVARVLQPYRVRGARAPGPAARQDDAWLEIVAALRRDIPDVPLIQGGRSNGARVTCRTARAAGARGVLALAFPLHPPGKPDRSRVGELRAAGTDVLVISGSRDPFGVPEPGDATRVLVLAGQTHALAGCPDRITGETEIWLRELLGRPARPARTAG